MGDTNLIIGLKKILMKDFLESKSSRDLTPLDYCEAEDFARKLIPDIIREFKVFLNKE